MLMATERKYAGTKVGSYPEGSRELQQASRV